MSKPLAPTFALLPIAQLNSILSICDFETAGLIMRVAFHTWLYGLIDPMTPEGIADALGLPQDPVLSRKFLPVWDVVCGILEEARVTANNYHETAVSKGRAGGLAKAAKAKALAQTQVAADPEEDDNLDPAPKPQAKKETAELSGLSGSEGRICKTLLEITKAAGANIKISPEEVERLSSVLETVTEDDFMESLRIHRTHYTDPKFTLTLAKYLDWQMYRAHDKASYFLLRRKKGELGPNLTLETRTVPAPKINGNKSKHSDPFAAGPQFPFEFIDSADQDLQDREAQKVARAAELSKPKPKPNFADDCSESYIRSQTFGDDVLEFCWSWINKGAELGTHVVIQTYDVECIVNALKDGSTVESLIRAMNINTTNTGHLGSLLTFFYSEYHKITTQDEWVVCDAETY